MQATLGSLLDRLQGFFGKSYFLAGFLPMMIFEAANILLISAVFPRTQNTLQAYFALGAAEQALNWLGALLLSFILGLLVWSLNPWLRQMLEGRHLPGALSIFLTRIHKNEFQSLTEQRNALRPQIFDYRRIILGASPWIEKLKEARLAGKDQPASQPDSNLRKQYEELDQKRSKLDKIQFAEMQALFDLLRKELSTKPADQVNELDALHGGFLELLAYAHQEFEADFERLNHELGIRFPRNSEKIGPTRLANLTEIQREYGLQRYGLDIELFWLRLLKMVLTDEKFNTVLDDTKTQLDFSVTTTTLLGLLSLVWIPLTLIFSPTLQFFILVAILGPLSTWIFAQMVVQNYRGFAETVRSAVDLYRFDLLKTLHLPLPQDSEQERATWKILMAGALGEATPVIVYQHPEEKDSKKSATADKPAESPKPQDIYLHITWSSDEERDQTDQNKEHI